MVTDKDAADKAKADVERVEAQEDEARAKSGQGRQTLLRRKNRLAELRLIDPSRPPDPLR
jgi:hypothetical protein